MADITILTPEELTARDSKPTGKRAGRRRSDERTMIIDSYKQALQGAGPGFGGEVSLDEGEEKRIVRQNLKAAAEELDLILSFRPIKQVNQIKFLVITPAEKAAQPKR